MRNVNAPLPWSMYLLKGKEDDEIVNKREIVID
jgi:hypothetical protein